NAVDEYAAAFVLDGECDIEYRSTGRGIFRAFIDRKPYRSIVKAFARIKFGKLFYDVAYLRSRIVAAGKQRDIRNGRDEFVVGKRGISGNIHIVDRSGFAGFDDECDDKVFAIERNTAIDANFRIAVSEFAKQRNKRCGIFFENVFARISAAVAEKRNYAENIRRLRFENRAYLLNGKSAGFANFPV